MTDISSRELSSQPAKDAAVVKTTKNVKVQARMELSLKQSAEAVFERLGVSPTESIRIFYTQVSLHRGFPFEVKIPNRTTLAALEETEHPNTLETCNDIDEFLECL